MHTHGLVKSPTEHAIVRAVVDQIVAVGIADSLPKYPWGISPLHQAEIRDVIAGHRHVAGFKRASHATCHADTTAADRVDPGAVHTRARTVHHQPVLSMAGDVAVLDAHP
jgi:hypothetical protein